MSTSLPPPSFIKPALVCVAGLVMAALVYVQLDPLNGPFYWKWAWRSLPAASVYPPLFLAVLPLLAAQFLKRDRGRNRALAILALMLSCFAMKVAITVLRTGPPSLEYISTVVENPLMTSYHTDAVSVKDLSLREWISSYPQRMEQFHLHTKSKPPGPVLYWWTMIQLFGDPTRAAQLGGLLLGLISVLAIPATYLLLRLLLGNEPAAFAGASFLALCPGFVLFMPMMDPTYILLSTAMIGTWAVALRDNRRSAAVALGLVLAGMMMISFSMLVIGAFMLGLVFVFPADRPLKDRIRYAAQHAGLAAIVMIGALLLLRMIFGYNPLATFLSAWHHQHDLLEQYAYQRPYPKTILFDLTDFAMGSGWISVAIVVCWLASKRHGRGCWGLVILAIAQLLIVAVTGLLQSETSRVWNFMLPLWMIPVGLELSRWPRAGQIACLATLALLTAVIHQNMGFLF